MLCGCRLPHSDRRKPPDCRKLLVTLRQKPTTGAMKASRHHGEAGLGMGLQEGWRRRSRPNAVRSRGGRRRGPSPPSPCARGGGCSYSDPPQKFLCTLEVAIMLRAAVPWRSHSTGLSGRSACTPSSRRRLPSGGDEQPLSQTSPNRKNSRTDKEPAQRKSQRTKSKPASVQIQNDMQKNMRRKFRN